MTALLVVGHGTRDPDGVAGFTALVRRVAARAGAPAVDGGFIELSAPPVGEAVARLVAAGHDDIAAVPLVLVSAGHAKGDIPGSLARERARHPGLRLRYGRPLGVHPAILALLTERLEAAVPREQWPHTAVVLVGRGSTDPDANAEVFRAARMLWEGRGIALVEASFVSLTPPGVGEALERCRRIAPEINRVVVLPLFLFAGVLPDRIKEQAIAYGMAHPQLSITVAEVIGDCDGLSDLVVDRYHEAIAGDIRMNCDACIYRVALPGFEDRVGADQHPHDHPHEHGHQHAH